MNNTAVTVIVGVIALILGFFLGTMMTDNDGERAATSTPSNVSQNTPVTPNAPATSTPVAPAADPDEVAFTIETERLPELQQQALISLGIEETELEITNAMVSCVESEVGSSRMMQIRNGATTTVSESVTLVGCYSGE